MLVNVFVSPVPLASPFFALRFTLLNYESLVSLFFWVLPIERYDRPLKDGWVLSSPRSFFVPWFRCHLLSLLHLGLTLLLAPPPFLLLFLGINVPWKYCISVAGQEWKEYFFFISKTLFSKSNSILFLYVLFFLNLSTNSNRIF